MSYCRINSESDVYVCKTQDGIVCYNCRVKIGPDENGFFTVKGSGEMLVHLIHHVTIGEKVPFKAIERLWKEINNDN